MQPRLKFLTTLLTLLANLTFCITSTTAQCPISYKNSPQGTINLVLGGNCSTSFDATTFLNGSGNCTLLYFKDAGMTVAYIGLPTFDASAIGQNTDIYVTADDGNPTTPVLTPLKFNIKVLDTTSPALSCPSNQKFNISNGNCVFTINSPLLATAIDNCSASNVYWTLSGATVGTGNGALNGTILNVGRTTIFYTATDVAGNSSVCSALLDVSENTAPTLVSCPSNTTLNAAANTCQAQITSGLTPSFTDNCTSIAQLALEYQFFGATIDDGIGSADNSTFNVGQTVVQYTAVDRSGNTNTSCVFTVTVNDIEKPIVICPINATTNTLADSSYSYIPTSNVTPFIADNCGQNNLSIFYEVSGATQTAETSHRNIGQQRFNFGVSQLTYTVRDASGNSNSCVQQISVLDTTPPKINCNNINIDTFANAGECAKVLQLNPPIYTDNITATNLLALSYTCNGSLSISGNGPLPSGQAFNSGITKVTYRVRDQQSNSAECSFVVLIREGTMIKPTITCPKDVTVATQMGLCSATIRTGLAPDSLSDNCTPKSRIRLKAVLSGATMVNDTILSSIIGVNGFTFNTGETIIQYTATDASGYSATSSFKVTIIDQERPVINCINDLTVTLNSGCSGRIGGLKATAADNCTVSDLQFSYKISGATAIPGKINSLDLIDFYTGLTQIDCYVQDAALNQDSCHFYVTVLEKNKPIIKCPSDTLLSTTLLGCSGLAINIANPVFSDDCSPNADLRLSFATSGSTAITGTNTINGNQFNLGVSKVTYTVTDFSSNTASCSFEISVKDVVTPSITCPANTTVNGTDSTCFVLINSPDVAFSDNCSSSISYEISGATIKTGNGIFNNEQLNFGKNIVRYTVSDLSANTNTCSFELYVKDNFKPEITCPNDVNLETAASCSALLPLATPLIRDNCGGIGLSYTIIGASTEPNGVGVIKDKIFQLGLSRVTYIATDANDNTAACSFTVTVTDKTAPSAVCRPDITIALDNTGNAYLPSVLLDNGSFDNCSTPQQLGFSSSKDRFNCSNIGINTIQLLVKDLAGNEHSCLSKVTVVNSFPNLLLNASIEVTDESYWGAKDGRAVAKVSGGTGNYSYSWNTGSNLSALFDIGAGSYTVTVTDKASSCSSTATAILNEGPRLTLTAGNIISTTGTVVTVPIRVQNFNKMKHLSFSLDLQNSLVGSIVGVDNFAVNMNDSGSYSINAAGIKFSKFFRENNGVTLANGTALFSLKIRLEGPSGTYSTIVFGNTPSAPTALQVLPTGLTSIPMKLIDGSVGINNGNAIAKYTGTIRREDGVTVKDARVSLTGTRVDSFTTLKDGNYSFSLTLGARAVLRPTKNDIPRTGLTAIDALLLQRHILGYQSLNSNYKKIAADVNRSGNLTALDVSEIKRVILGYQPTFRNNTVWRFVPKSYVFPNMTQNQVLGFPDSLANNYALNNQDSMDFVAIKTGDINLSANLASGRGTQSVTLNIDDRSVEKNDIFDVQISSSEKVNLAAIQAGIKVNSSELRLIGISSNLKDFNAATDCNFDQSELKMAWINANMQTINDNENLVTLRFEAVRTLNSIKKSLWLDEENNSNLLADEMTEKTIVLAFIDSEKVPVEEVEIAIFPNPASEILNISHPGLEAIVLTDVNGKVLLKETFPQPVIGTIIQVGDIPSGTCFVSLIAQNAIVSRKIIIVH